MDTFLWVPSERRGTSFREGGGGIREGPGLFFEKIQKYPESSCIKKGALKTGLGGGNFNVSVHIGGCIEKGLPFWGGFAQRGRMGGLCAGKGRREARRFDEA